jgi:hypothetical protein
MERRAKIIPFPHRGPAASGPREAAPGAGDPGVVEVHRCDRPEALVAAGLLESHGIPALLRSRLAHSVHPFSVGDQGEVVILVPAMDAARARLLLRSADRREA